MLDNKVKTTGFAFNKVFEENRNTTTPSFVAYQLTKDSNGTAQFEFKYSKVGGTHQYSLADGLEYGRTYVVMESNTPDGYETAKPFKLAIDLDSNGNAYARVVDGTNIIGDAAKGYTLTNLLKQANYKIQYHYQQLDGNYVIETESEPISARVGDDIGALTFVQDNGANPDPKNHLNGTTTSVYVFNETKTVDANTGKVVVENVTENDITVLDVYFDLRFAVQYHWKDADGVVHNDATNTAPIFDLTLADVVTNSENQSPDAEAQPDDPWFMFNGQWYATTQSSIAYDWKFDNSKQWLKDSDQLNQENILTYVEDNILHLYAAWSAKPAAKGNIQVSKTVNVVNEKEGNTDRDKLFEFALDLYVTTGSGLTFEQAKANTTSPSALNFNVFFTDKDGLAFAQPEATLTDNGNGHYLYKFFLRDGDTVDFDVNAVASTGSALVWFQIAETSASENAGFATVLKSAIEDAVQGLLGIGCIGEDGRVYTFDYVNTFTYEKEDPDKPPVVDPDPDPDPVDPPEVIIPDPEPPLVEPVDPTEPTEEITDPDVPLIDVPGEEVEIPEPEVPLGDAPKTGDTNNAVPFVVLMMAAGLGLVITRRRFN